jgi:hypothetical protein
MSDCTLTAMGEINNNNNNNNNNNTTSVILNLTLCVTCMHIHIFLDVLKACHITLKYIIIMYYYQNIGTCGSIVAWDTMLQAGGLRV